MNTNTRWIIMALGVALFCTAASADKTANKPAKAACPACAAAEDAKPKAKKSDQKALFEKIKSLAGEWVGSSDLTGKDGSAHNYKVTSGGSAVMEIEFPGTDHEMVSLYTLDSGSLIMTHYCAAGNQPKFRATADSTPDKITFECVGGTGMKSHNDFHIHGGTVQFTKDGRIVSDWMTFKDGKVASHVTSDEKRK